MHLQLSDFQRSSKKKKNYLFFALQEKKESIYLQHLKQR